MFRTIKLSAVVLSLLLVISIHPSAQKIETEGGVKRIHNEKGGIWGNNPKLALEFVRNLGELDSDDDNVLFFQPSDIAFDADGNLYVLDAGNQRIQKFSAEGKYLSTIGRRGEGPGELQFPLSLDIDAQGYMYVPDMGNQRIQVYTPEGIAHRGISTNRSALGSIRILPEGSMLQGTGGMMIMGPGGIDRNAPPAPLFKVRNPEGEIVKEFGNPHNFKDFLLNRMGNQYMYSVAPDGSVLVAFNFQNRIEKYSADGKIEWNADRPLNYDTKAPKSKGNIRSSGGNVMIEAPRLNRASNGIAVDGQGRIWVVNLVRQIKDEEQVNARMQVSMSDTGKRNTNVSYEGNTDLTRTDMYQIEVYDGDGILLTSFPIDHFADAIRIKDDRIFILDKMRGAQFYEYRIIEK